MNRDFFIIGSRPLIFLFLTKILKAGISPGKKDMGPSLKGSTSESYLASGGNMGTASSDQVYFQ